MAEHSELIKRCRPEFDDIVFPRIGTLGFAKRIDFEEEVSLFVGLGLLKPIKDVVIPKYLEYYMNTPTISHLSHERATGTGRMTLALDESRKLPIVIAPFSEQHRIVEAIESYFTRLDDAIATLERVQRNLKRYRTSVLKAAVEGRLVPTEAKLAGAEGRDYEPAEVLLERILEERQRRWIEDAAEKGRAKAEEKAKKAGKPWTLQDDEKTLIAEREKAKKKYKEPAAPDTEELPELTEGWCWASPGEFFSWSSGDFLPKKNHRDGDIPIYGGNGINGHHDESLLDEPTIVIGRVGAHCGNIHLTEGPAWVTDNAIYAAYRPIVSNLTYWQMVMSQQNLNANAGGTGQPYVNQKHLNDLVVPLPPEAEQSRIVAEIENNLSVTDHIAAELDRNKARCGRFRQSILKWAFEGKLVDQDPTDEPASVLLDRIKAEREAAASSKPRRKKRAKT